MSNYLWLSYVIDENTPLYAGEKGISCRVKKSIAQGDSCNTQELSFPSHTGTHIDAPRHFFARGKPVDAYSTAELIFNKVRVITLPNVKPGQGLTEDDIGVNRHSDESRRFAKQNGGRLKPACRQAGILTAGTECLLIKTGFSKYRKKDDYWRGSPYITAGLAEFLRSIKGLKAIGLDFISVSNINNREEGRAAHKILLSNKKPGQPILLIEDMDLCAIKDNITKLFVFPLRFKNADGAPCSVAAEIKSQSKNRIDNS